MRARGIASVALGAIVLSAAPPSVALGASQIAQSDSTDPAIEGSTVTYTTTIATGESDSRMVSLSVLLIKAETDGAVDNPLLSATASQGSCAIETPETYFGYWHLSCDLGILGRGEVSRRSGFRPATGRAGCEDQTQDHEQDSHGRAPQRRRLPELRELLRLLFPRWLAFRSDLPLE